MVRERSSDYPSYVHAQNQLQNHKPQVLRPKMAIVIPKKIVKIQQNRQMPDSQQFQNIQPQEVQLVPKSNIRVNKNQIIPVSMPLQTSMMTQPRISPDNFNRFNGFPSNSRATRKIGEPLWLGTPIKTPGQQLIELQSKKCPRFLFDNYGKFDVNRPCFEEIVNRHMLKMEMIEDDETFWSKVLACS